MPRSCAHLQESGALLVGADGRWQIPAELAPPRSVRDVIRGRAARLGEHGAQLLRSAAAVIGREFAVDLLAEVAGTDVELVLDELERAAQVALVVEHPDGDGRYAFVHALIKHALEDELGAIRAARLHRRVAEALERRDRSDRVVADLARHWGAADGPLAGGEGAALRGRRRARGASTAGAGGRPDVVRACTGAARGGARLG